MKLIALALLLPLLEGYSSEPCKRAVELQEQIELIGEQTQVLIDQAKPICAKKRESKWAADECARRRVEIEGFLQQLKELNAEHKKAKAECAAKP